MATSGYGRNFTWITILSTITLTLLSRQVNTDNSLPPWYKGCQPLGDSWVNVTSETGNHDDGAAQDADVSAFMSSSNRATEAPPVTCSRQCALLKYNYAGILNGTQCLCSNQTYMAQNFQDVSGCDISCTESDLPCGGVDEVSIYRVRGPYILRSHLQTEDAAIIDEPVMFQVTIQLAAPPTVHMGTPGQNTSNFSGGQILITWFVEGRDVHQEVTTKTQITQASLSHRFSRQGNYGISVTATNELSTITARGNQTIVSPAPVDLQVTLLTDRHLLPACVPTGLTIPENRQTVLVFTDLPVTFQASVTLGRNLTFVWQFHDDGSNHDCGKTNCSEDTQSHVFRSHGQFHVDVTVFNDFGTLRKSVYVVVLDRTIRNVSENPLSSSDIVTSPQTPLVFNISLEAAEPHMVTMTLDYGDSTPSTRPLSKGQSRKVEDDPTKNSLSVLRGVGCQVIVELRHLYTEEGAYEVSIGFSNTNQSQITRNWSILVMNKMVRASLQNPEHTATNSDVLFVISLQVGSKFAQYIWLFHNQDGSLHKNISTNSSEMTQHFSYAGCYSLTVIATNKINSVEAVTSVHIQEPITGIAIRCLNHVNDTYVNLGSEVNCTASIVTGSNVQFQWHGLIGDDTTVTGSNVSSSVVHIFQRTGTYNISVFVKNRVSFKEAALSRVLVVEESIVGVLVSYPVAARVNDRVTLVFSALRGSSVTYALDIGGVGRHPYQGKWIDNNFSLSTQFGSAEKLQITVYAYNHVSTVTKIFSIIVQEEVKNLSIRTYSPIIVNVTGVLLASIDAAVGADVIYTWHCGGTKHVSLVPFINVLFNKIGPVFVTLTARNLVSEMTVNKTIVVSSYSGAVYLAHTGHTAISTPTAFSVQNTAAGDVRVHFDTGDGPGSTLEYKSPPNQSIMHTYKKIGVYFVYATVQRKGHDNVTLSSVLSVQQPITKLGLSGPSAIPVNSMDADHSWCVSNMTGSHVTFLWSFGEDEPAIITTRNTMGKKFDTVGRFQVSVTAKNDISDLSENLWLDVQYEISALHITAPPVIQGQHLIISLMITGGKESDIYVDFGDDFSKLYPSVSGNASSLGQNLSTNSTPVYEVLLYHLYDKVGHYQLFVNASNKVSWLSGHKLVKVEEAISGISLTCHTRSSSSCPLVKLGEKITVVVTVETGNDLTYIWDLGEDLSKPEVTSSDNTSTATLLYTAKGRYQISVNVTNPLYKTPMNTRLPFLVVVGEPVDDMALTTATGKFAAGIIDGKSSIIEFEASVGEGTEVVFTFDFGDGTPTERVNGTKDHIRMLTRAAVSHSYFKVGTYSVTAVASNAWRNESITKPFHVQVAPRGLSLPDYRTRKGQTTALVASLQQGTDVWYSWNMGDNTINITTQENTLSYKYVESGSYQVSMLAYNRIGQDTTTATVDIEEHIQSVILEVDKSMVKTREVVRLTATASPTGVPRLVQGYVFFLGDAGKSRISLSNRYTHSYRFPRKYYVSVTAYNNFSSVKSKAVEIHVVEEIAKFLFYVRGNLIIKKPVSFEAYTFKGSDITYTWDFGDGSPVVTTEGDRMVHVYKRKGRYEVNLNMSNPFGNISHTEVIFIMERSCHQPTIKILWKKGHKVFRSSEVKVEADVRVNCSITNSAVYTWTLRKLTDNSIVPQPVLLENGRIFDDRMFYLPQRFLEYGDYSLTLRVKMKGLIVEAETSTQFRVIATPLVPVISGGIQRQVSRSDYIVMDASNSIDPDRPDNRNFTYTWSCYELSTRNASCFIPSQASVLTSSEQSVSFPGHFLTTNYTDFVFTLTLGQAGRASESTNQVLKVYKGTVLDVQVVCPQCDDAEINSDERLMLHANCSGCQNEDQLEYEWQIFRVIDANDNFGTQYKPYGPCVQADGSTWLLVYPNTTQAPGAENVTDSNSTMTTETTTVSTVTKGQSSTTSSTATKTSTASSSDDGDMFGGGISEGGGDNTGHDGSNGFGGDYGGFGGFEGGGSDGDGLPSEGGSDSGSRDNGDSSQNIPEEGTDNNGRPDPDDSTINTGSNKKGGSVDAVVDGSNPWRRDPHIIHRRRYQIYIPDDKSSTGMLQKTLVLRPGALEQGATYMIQVIVYRKDNKASGRALAYFYVNESPRMGKCTINSGKGVEMETDFKIFCYDWTDKNEPIQYEVSYMQPERPTRDIIYQGLNNDIDFQLPAGGPQSDGSIEVSIAILDSLGARTTVCSLQVKVTPKTFSTDTRQSEEDVLYGLVDGPDSLIQKYVEKGDTRNARLHTHLLANKLNSLQDKHVQGKRLNQRRKIRTKLVNTLDDLPMRDQFEILQTTSAVVSSTEVPAELTQDCLHTSSAILNAVAEHLYVRKAPASLSSNDVVTLTVEGTSNILAAATQQTNENTRKVKEIVTTSTSVIQKILSNELRDHVIGEEPIAHKTDHVSAYAGRFKTDSQPPTIMSQDVQFRLPQNIDNVLHNNAKVKQSGSAFTQSQDCSGYQAQMVTFKMNPYTFGNSIQKVESVVASLTLYNCGGEELKVADLPQTDEIQIRIPQTPKKQPREKEPEHSLHKHMMNVHQFNVTRANLMQVLHVVMDMSTPLSSSSSLSGTAGSGRLFPISFLISYERPPTPKSFILRYTFDRNENSPTIFLPPGSLNETGTYYLGIVDSSYNAHRPRPGEVQQRDYRLQMIWGQCLFWDAWLGDWSSSGCQMKPSSSYHVADCACNHLTAFGAHISLAPNDLDFSKVEDFFDLHENPVTFSFVAVILLVYIILVVICRQLDVHDRLKDRPVPLLDNNTSDQYVYVIIVETGFRKNAGTTAKVSMVLHGEEGMSETRELIHQDGQPLFERNSRDTFVMTLPDSLGPIWKVQLWHNNAGTSPSWYLSRVIVKDLSTGNNYYFLCEKWFAVEETDGKVEREVMAHDGGLGFNKVLWAKGAQYFIDYHLWCSVFTRPPQSRFTRVQRLSCCLSLLTSYMCVNAMWYQVAEKEYRGEFGLLDVSWRSIIVGFFTCIIILPVNLLIAFLFRRSKVKRSNYTDKGNTNGACDSDNAQQPTVVPSILDQSILNWQSLQEWAQKTWAKRYQQSVMSSAESVKPISQGIQQAPPSAQIQQQQQQQHTPSSDQTQQHDNARQSVNKSNNNHNGDNETRDEDLEASENSGQDDNEEMVTSRNGQHSSSTEREMVRNDRENSREYQNQNQSSPPSDGRIPSVSDQNKTDQPQQRQADHSLDMSREGSSSGHGSPSSIPLANRDADMPTDRSSSGNEFCLSSDRSKLLRPLRSPAQSSSNRSVDSGVQITATPKSTKTPRLFLPCWCVWLGWLLCAVVVSGSSAVTVLYGFRFGAMKSTLWLQSLLFSFLSCMFFSHPLLILAVTIYTAMRYRNDINVFDHHDDGYVTDELVNDKLPIKPRSDSNRCEEKDDLEKGIAARQRSRYLRFARPPQEKQLIAARKSIMKQKKAYACFWEGAVFTLIFILTVIITYGKFGVTNYLLNQATEAQFVRNGNMSFTSIKTVSDWWSYMESGFVDSLFWDTWYNGQVTDSQGFVRYGSSLLIGDVNLRQLRVKQSDCDVGLPYLSHRRRCRYAFSSKEEDDRAFGANKTWLHVDEETTHWHGIWARHGHYSGSGYLLKLPSQKSEAVALLQSLRTSGWVDPQTRALLIQLTLFHAPSSLFSCVTLLLETPPTGGVHPYRYVDSVYLFKYTSLFDNVVLACELLFIVAMFFKIRDLVCEMLRLKSLFFQDPWNWLDVSISLVAVLFVVCLVYRFVLVHHTVELIRSTYHESFVDVSFVAVWDHVLRTLCGVLLFLLLIMSLKLLRHRNPFAKFGVVYKRASADLAVMGLFFIIWLSAYTGLGLLAFQSVSHNFVHVDSTLLTLLGIMTGSYSFADINEQYSLGSRIFIASFLIFVVGLLTAHAIAILSFYYKVYLQEEVFSMSIKDALRLLCNDFIHWTGLKKAPLIEEEENVLSPEFTLAEIEYQVDELLFKMNALAGTHGLPEKPAYYLTDSDSTCHVAEDGLSSAGSEMRAFDDERFETRIQKIEDNLYSHEPHLAQLIKLNNIGADVLSHENQKQLWTQLELEIFRQLQLHRPEGHKEESSPPIRSQNELPGQLSPATHPHSKSFPVPPQIDPLFSEDIEAKRSLRSGSLGSHRHSKHRYRQHPSFRECLLDDIPLKDMTSSPHCHQRTPPSSTAGGDTAETTLTESSALNSSGASEVISSLHRSRRHKLPPIETINQLSNESIANLDNIAPPPVGTGVFTGYDDLFDSSSGSELEKTPRNTGKRSLRKTKSRGKGKGLGELSSMQGVHELSFDNGAYCSSASDQDLESQLTSGSSTQRKQCWS